MIRLAVGWCVAIGAVLAAASADRPTLTLPDLAGNLPNTERHGGKVVVLNFWATWRLPCREEMPMLDNLQ